jgi:hypothetical protein
MSLSILRSRAARCRATLLAAALIVGCGEGPELLVGWDDFVLVPWPPDGSVGTWKELGPDVILWIRPLSSESADSPLFARFLSFRVDGEEWLGRPEFNVTGASEFSGKVTFPELAPGEHDARAFFIDVEGRGQSVAWRFEVLEDDGSPP